MTNDVRPRLATSSRTHAMLPADTQQEDERCADRLIRIVAEAQIATEVTGAVVGTPSDESAQAATAAFHRWRAHEARVCQSIPARRHDAEHAARFAAKLVAARRAASVILPVVAEVPIIYAIDAPRVRGTAACEHGTTRHAPCADFAVAAGTGREIWDEPTTTAVELPDCVPAGNYLALAVHGNSMRPLLHPGDTLLVKRDEEWRRGALVVAHRPEHGFVVKQVGQMTATTVELTSLNPDYPSVLIPRDGQLLIGSVVLRWCPHDP